MEVKRKLFTSLGFAAKGLCGTTTVVGEIVLTQLLKSSRWLCMQVRDPPLYKWQDIQVPRCLSCDFL